ncbi:MAG: DUF6816 family protein [Nodosilinea sp.]
MARPLLLLLRRRRFWLVLLVTIWLLCSGQAQAGPWQERLQRFPNWGDQPTLPAAQGDLVYPDWLQGTWTLTSTLVDLAAPLAPAIVTPGFDSNRAMLDLPVACQVRFVVVPRVATGLVPRVTQETQTVADRAFNGLNLARAYLGQKAVKAVKVDPQNPNRQVTLLAQGRQLEATVSARATEAPSPQRFITVERVQQVFRGTAIPYLNEVETTTDYSPVIDGPSGKTILADQVTAVYLSPQDPDFLTARKQPVALYRYRLELSQADLPS